LGLLYGYYLLKTETFSEKEKAVVQAGMIAQVSLEAKAKARSNQKNKNIFFFPFFFFSIFFVILSTCRSYFMK